MALSFSYGLFEETAGCSKTHSVVSTNRSSSWEGLGAWKHGKPLEWRSKRLDGFVMCQNDHLILVGIALQWFVILECPPEILELVLPLEQSTRSRSYGWKAVNTKRWKEGEILKSQAVMWRPFYCTFYQNIIVRSERTHSYLYSVISRNRILNSVRKY